MSELLEVYPTFTSPDASQSALEHHDLAPEIPFEDIATALSTIDPNLERSDYNHYMQELRIAEINLALLDVAKALFDDGEYVACQTQFNAIIAMVVPTQNEITLAKLRQAHDQLYI